jgi:hypothetical protein
MPNGNKKKAVLTEIADIQNVLSSFLGKLADSLSTETLKKTFKTVYDLSAETTREIGTGAESADAIRKNIAGSVAGIQNLGYGAQEAIKIAKGMVVDLSEVTGKNTQYNDKLFGNLRASSDLTGKSVKELTQNYTNIGYSLEAISEKTAKVFDIAMARGLNGRKISDEMLSNMSAMDKFTFQGGIDGFTKMAAASVQMRVGMESTLTLANKLLNPEAAIDTAAALQRLGVVQSDLLDPMRLMNMSQNDPAELQKQIAEMTKGFSKLNEVTGQMEILPGGRERLQAISKELDIPYKELTNMARAGSELESKLSSIKFPEMATEEQKTLIANMSRLNDKNEFVITVNGVEENMNDFIERSTKNGEFSNDMLKKLEPKTVEKLAQEQLTQLQLIQFTLGTIGVSRGLGQAVAASTIDASKMGQGFNESVANILRELEGKNTREITEKKEGFNPIRNIEEEGVGDMLKKFKESLFNIPKGIEQMEVETNKLPEPFNIVINELTEKLSLLGVGIGDVLSEISKKVKTQTGFDFIRTEDGDIDFFEKDTIIAGTGLNDIAKMIKGGNPIDTDFTQMISRGLNMPTKELENMSKNSATNVSSNENKVVIEVRVSTSNDNINPDLNQKIVDVVTQAFKDDMGLKQVVATSIKDVVTNGSRPS